MDRPAPSAGRAPRRRRSGSTPAPRLSWWLPGGARAQLAYRIPTDNGWDTGWVDSDQSLLVPYAGPPLRSGAARQLAGEGVDRPGGERMVGAARVRDRSARARRTGRRPGSSRSSAEPGPPGERPACSLRGEFDVARPVARARLHATAQGIYEAFLNGERVGDAELTPGYTQYDERLQVQTYDVTDLLRAGPQRARRAPGRRLVPRADRAHRARRPVGRPAGASSPSCSWTTTTAASPSSAPGTGWRSASGARRRRRPDRRRAVDLHAAAARLGPAPGSTTPAGTRSSVVEHGYARPGRLAGAAGAPRGGARAGLGPPARRRAGRRPRPEHQRLGPAARPRARRAPSSPSTHGEALDADGDVTTTTSTPTCRSSPSRCRPARSTRSSPPAARVRSSSRGGRRTASSTCASRATRTS